MKGGQFMRRLIPALIISVTLIGVNAYSLRGATLNPLNEKSVVNLPDKTMVGGVVLQGPYIFEHDYDRKARGEPCLCVYAMRDGQQAELVVAVHCMPVERPVARYPVVTVGMTEQAGVFKLTEIQFPGSTTGHHIVEG
jgi:hypothetical protein